MPIRASRRAAPEAHADEAPSRRRSILLAAERLFAERGYHAVSLRDIAAAAGVQVALLSYHYGAKHELYRAIFDSWQPMLRQRRAMLQAALDDPGGATPEAVLRAFIVPLVQMNAEPGGRYYARMASRELNAATPEADAMQREVFDPVANAFIDALQSLFPGASREQVAWCYQFALGALLHFLTDERVQRLSGGTARPADTAQAGPLVAFVAAGCRALLGEPRAPRARAGARRARAG